MAEAERDFGTAGIWRNATPVSRRLRSQQCGVVLGGIGTGGFEIWDDGHFHLWQIFNNGTWTGWTGSGYRTSDAPHFPSSGLSFALSTHGPDRNGIWKLHTPDHTSDQWIAETYQAPELQFPEAITYYGRQPFARLEYVLNDCPVEAALEAFTPFVVHDLDASAWPAAEFRVHLRNQTDREVHAAVVGLLANVVEGFADPWDRPHEILANEHGLTLLFPAPDRAETPAAGSMSLTVVGPGEELSHVRKWNAAGINSAMFWDRLLAGNRLGGDESKLSRLMNVCADARRLGWGKDGKELDALGEDQRRALADVLRTFPEMRMLEKRVPLLAFADETDRHGRRDMMLEETLRTLCHEAAPFFGSVGRTIRLPGGGSECVRFILAWLFPCHFQINTGWGRIEKGVEPFEWCDGETDRRQRAQDAPREKILVGHRYETRGRDALEITNAYLKESESLRRRSTAFIETLYDTTLPTYLIDALNAQLTSLVTNGIYDRQGRFALWAGCGACGFNEMGNGFFSTFLLNVLFPDASKRQVEMLARYQAPDGRIPHLLCDFHSPIGHYDDDNFKFLLKVYCDWLWTGDEAYFQAMWPRAVRVLEACRRLDGDHDGVPDVRGYNQDYDQWLMFGLGAYHATHWPVALQVMAKMAHAAGDDESARRWETQASQAAAIIDDRLWNGRWYSLYVDSAAGTRDDSILANALLGEWYAHVMGLDRLLPEAHVRAMLRAVFERNRVPGVGLKNGRLTEDKRREPGLRDWHWHVCWLGVEYAVAAHMIYEGMLDEGLLVCREAFERHINQGLRFNHFECGEHYIRAFTIWTVFLALQGLRWDAVKRFLRFRPAYPPADHRSVLLLPSAWGTLCQHADRDGRRVEISLREGQLPLRTLELSGPVAAVTVNGIAVNFRAERDQAVFDNEIILESGSTLAATLAS